jgi:hypothetical protein
VYHIFKPSLERAGYDLSQVDMALHEFESAARNVSNLPVKFDRFNDMLTQKGWIAYDTLRTDVIEAAVEHAENGKLDEAEQILVDHFDEKLIRTQLATMIGIKAFRPRMALAQKALVDYSDGRYYACVLVVLSLLDGLVHDLGQLGFFYPKANLEAWDSIAGHSRGLPELSKVFGQARDRTNPEPIFTPFRHGIVHGLDVNYDYKIVAAKAWAALFAARNWAYKVERGETGPPAKAPEQPAAIEDLVAEFIATVQRYAEEKHQRESWIRMTIQFSVDVPSSGNPEDYTENTPERKLAEFLSSWKARNYGNMARCFERAYQDYHPGPQLAARLNEFYRSRRLQTFEFLDLVTDDVSIAIIKTRLLYDHDGSPVESVREIALQVEGPDDKIAQRSRPGAKWVILDLRLT